MTADPTSSPDRRAFDPEQPTAELILWSYRRGIFPMAEPRTGQIGWYSPDPRGVIPLDRFHVPRTLRRVLRLGRLDVRSDTAFEAVMRACAEPRPGQPETWIDERLVAAFVELHERGAAHSIEAWRDDRLVGGLYGLSIGGAFFGESMFVRPAEGGTDASKVCLVALVHHLRRCGATLLDTQFWNPHLDQFGCVEIPRRTYLARLERAVELDVPWDPFEG
jgi:leucyl/phenylalanyl-tRNA--protein transferase